MIQCNAPSVDFEILAVLAGLVRHECGIRNISDKPVLFVGRGSALPAYCRGTQTPTVCREGEQDSLGCSTCAWNDRFV